MHNSGLAELTSLSYSSVRIFYVAVRKEELTSYHCCPEERVFMLETLQHFLSFRPSNPTSGGFSIYFLSLEVGEG